MRVQASPSLLLRLKAISSQKLSLLALESRASYPNIASILRGSIDSNDAAALDNRIKYHALFHKKHIRRMLKWLGDHWAVYAMNTKGQKARMILHNLSDVRGFMTDRAER